MGYYNHSQGSEDGIAVEVNRSVCTDILSDIDNNQAKQHECHHQTPKTVSTQKNDNSHST